MKTFATEQRPVATRAYVSCGAYEGLAEDVRAFVPALGATGTDVRYEQVADGHHWTNWRNRLGAALTTLFPGEDPDAVGNVRR